MSEEEKRPAEDATKVEKKKRKKKVVDPASATDQPTPVTSEHNTPRKPVKEDVKEEPKPEPRQEPKVEPKVEPEPEKKVERTVLSLGQTTVDDDKPKKGLIPAAIVTPKPSEEKTVDPREERRRRLKEAREVERKKASDDRPRVQQMKPDNPALERLTKFGGASPLGRLVTEEAIKRMNASHMGREARLKPSGKEGIFPSTFQTKYMVWGRVGSAYSAPEEFCAYVMVEFVKDLLFNQMTDAEKMDPNEEKYLYRLFDKYFATKPSDETVRRQFMDAKTLQKEQDPRMSPFQKFMFDYSSFRNSYMSFLRYNAGKLGIYGPAPAQIIVYDTFPTEQQAVDKYEELKRNGEDVDRLFVSPIGALLPFNPTVLDAKVDIAQEDAAKMLAGINRNRQMTHMFYHKGVLDV